MQVKCTQEFFDKKNGVKRKVGEIFDVTEERAKEITDFQEAKGKKYIEKIEEQPPEESPEQQVNETQEQTAEETIEEQQANEAAPKAAKKAKKAAGADNE